MCALTTGVQFIESGRHKKVLVIGADKMSAITNYDDRTPCVLFGDAAAKKMGLDAEQVVINIAKYGNTTAATIPLAMSETYRDNKLKKRDWVVMAAFGAGFTWGSMLLRWALDSGVPKVS